MVSWYNGIKDKGDTPTPQNNNRRQDMKNITLVKRLFDTEAGWETIEHTIVSDELEVGKAYVITKEGEDESYLEDIVIEEEHRNKGLGTAAIRALAKEYGYIYFAPTDENNKRLYDRIAEEEPAYKDHDAVDQGFGIYYLEG